MMLMVSIGALMTILLILFLAAKGYYFILIAWLGSVFGLTLLGWLATIFIKPYCPEWWERNIAVNIDRDMIRL